MPGMTSAIAITPEVPLSVVFGVYTQFVAAGVELLDCLVAFEL
jgi:hypothetical protein